MLRINSPQSCSTHAIRAASFKAAQPLLFYGFDRQLRGRQAQNKIPAAASCCLKLSKTKLRATGGDATRGHSKGRKWRVSIGSGELSAAEKVRSMNPVLAALFFFFFFLFVFRLDGASLSSSAPLARTRGEVFKCCFGVQACWQRRSWSYLCEGKRCSAEFNYRTSVLAFHFRTVW